MHTFHKRMAYVGLAAALLLVTACARNPVTGRQELMLISEQQEIAMGQQSIAGAIAQYGLYDDEKLQRYIQEKGKAMAAVSHRPNLQWEFRVMDSPVVNAFAAPGGFVFFTRGIMAHFNNEAQFMGVLGHEIGHVTARHSASQMSKQMAAQLGMVAGIMLSPEVAQMADLLGQGTQLLFLKFSRDAESQSDRLGVEYSTRMGYNAEEMAPFFTTLERLQQQQGGGLPSFLSTHPDPLNREAAVDQLADEWRYNLHKDLEDLLVNREGYLELIDGMIYGNDPRQGYFEDGYFFHPELKFRFPVPRGWRLSNTPSQVAMITEDESSAMVLRLGEGSSPRQAAQQAVQNFELQVLESGATRVNGLEAFYVLGDAGGQNAGQTMRLLVFNIAYGELIYQFIGLSNPNAFNVYSDTFLRTMRGFDRLTDPSKLNRQPRRISIEQVPSNMTFEQAMRAFGMPASAHEELAILNGMELRQSLPAGSLLKVVNQARSGRP